MQPTPKPRPFRRHGVLLASSILAVALVAGGVAHLGLSDPAFARPEQTPTVAPARRELPREWRWQREAVTFDHMYMQER